MDSARVALMRDLLAGTGWVERTRSFGRALRRAPHEPGGLLVVGTPTEDPWHVAAHLDEEARWSNLPNLAPVLVRWSPPADAPAHLAIGLQRLERIGKHETVFVVAPDIAPASLLERLSDARKVGATVFAIDAGDPELEGLAHESLVVPGTTAAGPGSRLIVPEFEVVSHLVTAAAGVSASATENRLGGLRRRLARMLETVSDSDDSAGGDAPGGRRP